MQLSISTTSAACSVALLDGKDIVAEAHEIVGRGHAERLIPMIAGLPGNGRADAIWVDCGPGSFTGTRVGLAAAKALGLAWKVPVTGYSTLALIAVDATESPESIGIALQGGHGELFVQQFMTHPLAPSSAIASLAPDAAARLIDAPLVAGSGAEALVQARGHGTARPALPRAASASKLPESLRNLPPRAIYVRTPDAQPQPQPQPQPS